MAAPRYELRPTDPLAAGELGRALGLSPSIAQVLLHRGITSVEAAREFIDPKLAGLTDPRPMRDRDVAADRLARAIRAGERIAVFGDYDVDGTTATTILCGILERLGADVVAMAAHRFEGGYGFSDPALAKVKETGARVLVTCDCGSADHPRVEAAMRSGIDVIVVDHHLVPKETLPALAFLNPHRGDCAFAYKGMASAGLAFSLGAAVRQIVMPKLDPREFLDLVALGTVADVAPLDGDNRRLVRAGLGKLAGGDARPGVVALREMAKANGAIGGTDISFRLAPRLNAAGRLADAALTLSLLRARTIDEARVLAARVEEINGDRKAIQEQNTEEAAQAVRDIYLHGGSGTEIEGGIVVASSEWHRGVVGIVAARLTELFEAPAIVITLEGGHGHGSGRTVGGFPLFDAVKASSGSLMGFGGHQAALGVRIEASQIETFRADFDRACRELRKDAYGPRVRHVDVMLDGGAFPLPKASDLAALEPVGAGNPEPRFLAQAAKIEDMSSVGTGHLKLSLRLGRERVHAFGYGMGAEVERLGDTANVVGTLRPDTWRGGDAVELKIDALI
ncbi:MAG: single-stranded-DNA-specific exonuclease RecJ [Deltaproteobacteria bacterium]|nr:single-stranded-DNA-specific exonuclease RecJ [Deltaproteobacteria bacterium]